MPNSNAETQLNSNPSQLSISSQLMQNYAHQVQPLQDVYQMCVGVEQQATHNTRHLFVSNRLNQVLNVREALETYTGWAYERYNTGIYDSWTMGYGSSSNLIHNTSSNTSLGTVQFLPSTLRGDQINYQIHATGFLSSYDNINYSSQKLSGDGVIYAQISLPQPASSPLAYVGLMIRNNSGTTPSNSDSFYFCGFSGDQKIVSAARENNNSVATIRKTQNTPSSTLYFKINRQNNVFSAYYSDNEEDWNLIEQYTPSTVFSENIYWGISVSSGNSTNTFSPQVSALRIAPSSSLDSINIGGGKQSATTQNSAVFSEGGSIQVSGSGSDIWDKSDSFRFAYQKITGDATIIARINSIENTDDWAKAGVMIRNDLTAGSLNMFTLKSQGHGVMSQSRSTADQSTSQSDQKKSSGPVYLKVERVGNLFTSSYSSDAITWNNLASKTLAMNAEAYFGIAVTAHNSSKVCTATFDQVQIIPHVQNSGHSLMQCANFRAGNLLYLVNQNNILMARLASNDDNLNRIDDNYTKGWLKIDSLVQSFQIVESGSNLTVYYIKNNSLHSTVIALQPQAQNTFSITISLTRVILNLNLNESIMELSSFWIGGTLQNALRFYDGTKSRYLNLQSNLWIPQSPSSTNYINGNIQLQDVAIDPPSLPLARIKFDHTSLAFEIQYSLETGVVDLTYQNVTQYQIQNRDLFFDVYFLNNQYELYHLEYNKLSKVWASEPALIAKKVNQFALQKNTSDPEIVYQSTQEQIQILAKDEENVWQRKALYIQQLDDTQVTPFSSYVTELTIADQNGIALSLSPLYVMANDSDVEANINGEVYHLDVNDEPILVYSNSLGNVSIQLRSNSLHTPQIVVWGDVTKINGVMQKILIEPNSKQQKTLETITQQNLQSAQRKSLQNGDSNGGNLFASTSSVDQHFVDSLHGSMSLTQISLEAANLQNAPFLQFSDQTGVYLVQEDQAQMSGVRKVDRTALTQARKVQKPKSDQYFSIQYLKEGVKYIEHTLESFQAKTALIAPTVFTAQSTPNFTGSLGDILQAGNQNLITIMDVTVYTGTRDLWNVFVTFVMDSVEYVIQTTLDFISEAFALAESVFNKVKVFFSDIFEWLGDFFCWQDILNTQQFLNAFINKSITSTINSSANIQRNAQHIIDNAFDVNSNMPSSIQDSTANQSIATENSKRTSQNDQINSKGKNQKAQENWMLNQFNNYALGADALFDLGSLLSPLESAATQLNPGDGFDNIIQAIGSVVQDKQGNFTGQDIWSKILQTLSLGLHSCISNGIAMAGNITQVILQALQTLFNTHIQLPIITSLYETVIAPGTKLTLLNLVTLIPATVGTLVYKLAEEKAPIVVSGSASDQMNLSQVNIGDYSVPDLSFFSTTLQSNSSAKRDNKVDENASKVATNSRIFGFISGGLALFFMATDTLSRLADLAKENPSATYLNRFKSDRSLLVRRIFTGFLVTIEFIDHFISIPVYPWYEADKLQNKPENAMTIFDFSIWNYKHTLFITSVARHIFSVSPNVKPAVQKGVDVTYTLLGMGTVGLLCGFAPFVTQDKEMNDLQQGLLMTDDFLSAIGTVLDYPLDLALESSMDVRIKLGLVAVYELLFVFAPLTLLFVRTGISVGTNDKTFIQ